MYREKLSAASLFGAVQFAFNIGKAVPIPSVQRANAFGIGMVFRFFNSVHQNDIERNYAAIEGWVCRVYMLYGLPHSSSQHNHLGPRVFQVTAKSILQNHGFNVFFQGKTVSTVSINSARSF